MVKDSSPFPTALITTIPKTINYPTTIPTAIEERKEDELIQKLSPTTSDPTATTTRQAQSAETPEAAPARGPR